MEKSLQDKPTKAPYVRVVFRGHRRLFILVFALALLGQAISLLQDKVSAYHQALVEDFKVILVVNTTADNEALTAMGESLSAKQDITSVKLFAPADGLAALQARNARLASALVTLGREPMPSYFEIKLSNRAINNIAAIAQNIAAEYPQLAIKYAPEQAQMIFISGILIRTVNMLTILALVLLLVFMFLVEAYPMRGKAHLKGGVLAALLAWGLSFVLLAGLVYPISFLTEGFVTFTSVGRQIGLAVGCGLLGWTLSKWQKF